MRTILSLLVLLLMTTTLSAQTGSISVRIENVLVEWVGTLKIGVYDQKHFPKEGQALFTQDKPVRGLEEQLEFHDIPVGTYAIAVFQDINNDGSLDRDIYRRPEEPYGFSGNEFGRFGPPKFTLVSFTVLDGKTTELVIRLKQ